LVEPASLYTEFGFYTLVEELKEGARKKFELEHTLRPIAFIVHEKDMKTGKDLIEPRVSMVEPRTTDDLTERLPFSELVKFMAEGTDALGVVCCMESWVVWNGRGLDVKSIMSWAGKGKPLKLHPKTKPALVIMVDHKHFGKRMIVAEIKRGKYDKLLAWKDVSKNLKQMDSKIVSHLVSLR